MKDVLIVTADILFSVLNTYLCLVYVANWIIEIAENSKNGKPKEARYYAIACVWFFVIVIMIYSETKSYFLTSFFSAAYIGCINYVRAYMYGESLYLTDVTKRVFKTIKSVLKRNKDVDTK